ncbi:hypothetical protein CPC08DRAFT_6328 [Agrocybe pediades]|nr:hypothetical protein CPC08DRAFT_6328 [Agrocybe pediades]
MSSTSATFSSGFGTSSAVYPTDSFHSDSLFSATQPTSTLSDCPTNTVVIQLSTSLVIPNYALYYGATSISTFRPTYTALPDGSLIAPPFNADMADANLSLLVISALATVFARNILVSGDYIRRGKLKKKLLFYVLFLSQIISPVAFVPFIWSYFNQRLNCTIVIALSCVSGGFSLALLITVILGVKVYKCLNNAWFIPVVLFLLQAAAIAVIVLDVVATQGVRRLTGSCIRSDDLRYTRYFVVIQFAQSLFICGCFLYVCWKSRHSPAVRGRISIELSMDELPIEIPADPPEKPQPEFPPVVQKPKNIFSRVFHSKEEKSPSSKGKESKYLSNASHAVGNSNASRISLAPSSTTKLSRLFPRMELFQEVVKDELLYTTFITSTCVVIAVLAIIGVNFKNGLSVTGWIALNWGLISLVTIHSFGRVVHRHEREAFLQDPVTCNAIRQAANDIVRRTNQANRDPLDNVSTARNIRAANRSSIDANEDPFADTQGVEEGLPTPSVLDADFTSTVTISHAQRTYIGNDGSSSRHQEPEAPASPLGAPVIIVSGPEVLQRETFTRSWQTITPGFASETSSEHSFNNATTFK